MVFIWQAIQFIDRLKPFVKAQTLGWQMRYVYVVLPLAFSLMTIRILQVNYMKLVQGVDPRDPDRVERATLIRGRPLMDSLLIEILFGSFFALLLLGAPITVALGVSALAAMVYLGDNPIKMVQMAWSSVGSFPLMALPSFILAGALMEAAGLSRRLINVAESLAGPFTGGLSAATIIACLFF
ncbi:hypothetical protein PHISP_08501, partial [Aspergillus sp. HF37]